MDGLFNSKFMQAIQKGGQKFGASHFVGAIQGGMMSLLGVLMIGAFAQIIQSILGPTMLHILKPTDVWYGYLNLPYQFTMNFIALWVVALIGYQYAQNLQLKSPVITMLDSLVIFLMIAAPLSTNKAGVISINTSNWAAQGMFVGFLVAGVVGRIEWFCQNKNIRLKLPDVVPGFLQNSFSSIIPLLIEVIVFLGVHILIITVSGGRYDLASGFIALLSAPLNLLISTPGMFILLFIACLLWCFGIHGSLIIMSVMLPVSLQAVAVNAKLHAAGKALKFNAVFLGGALAVAGGTGNTFPLVLMGLKAKSQQIKAVSKVSLIPGWFNINEPVTFGMPVMYNPILGIPYILNVLVVALFYLIGFKTGILALPFIPITTVLPIGFGDYLGSLNPFNFVWDYLMIIVAGIIWFPFFKAYDNQLYKKEQAEGKAEAGTNTEVANA